MSTVKIGRSKGMIFFFFNKLFPVTKTETVK